MKVYKDEQGRFRTQSLFIETNVTPKLKPIFSLREEGARGLPSAHKMYMEAIDEYDAAMRIVGNMRHWHKLLATGWFTKGRPELGHSGLNTWRNEKQLRDESEAKAVLIKAAKDGSVAAARILYLGLSASEKGRPKDADIKKEARRLAASERTINSLYSNFKVISGA